MEKWWNELAVAAASPRINGVDFLVFVLGAVIVASLIVGRNR